LNSAKEKVMNRLPNRMERWGYVAAGIVLLGLTAVAWSYRAVSPIDMVVGGLGLGALLWALDGFLARRAPARRPRKKAAPTGRKAVRGSAASLAGRAS
jgi:hypothetical protein